MIGIGAGLLLGGSVVASIKLHDFIEAESLIADCVDEYRLANASLAEHDAAWEQNPSRCDAVVSLTTIPSRLPFIGLTLKSLMRQRLAPARIVLNLPRFSRRENKPYVVPDGLERLRSVEIRWCEDLGPATKLLPTLSKEPLDRSIIVVDDDRIYPPNLIRDLMTGAARHPGAAVAMRGWVVPPDLTDRPFTIWRKLRYAPPAPVRARRISQATPVDVVMGVSGYLVKPRFFDLAAVMNYDGAPREAFFVDDVWISAHLKVPRFVIPSRRVSCQPKRLMGLYNRTALAAVNRGPGPDSQRNNTIVVRHFRTQWMAASAAA